MTLQELKNEIINHKLNKNFMIFQYDENKFLLNQYIKAISNLLDYNILNIDNLQQCLPDDLFDSLNNYLYVYNIEKLDLNNIDEEILNAVINNNIYLIIVCNNIENQDTISLSINDYIISFPKLLEWQVLDYLSQLCKLDNNKLKWLYDICKGDIYRLESEIDKIKLFNEFEQEKLFNQINEENGYTDLSNYNIFNLTNALLKRDAATVKAILHDIEYIDVEPVGLVTIMIKNIKNVIDIQLDATATAEKLGMQKKQFIAISYNCGKYTTNELINVYQFLLDIDYKLKTGQLPFNNSRFIDYLVCNILNGGI